MNRVKILDALEAYFLTNGRMTLAEYTARKDAPIKPAFVKRHFNSWTRMETMLERRLSVLEAARENQAVELAEAKAEADKKAVLEAKKVADAKAAALAEKDGKDSK